MNTSITIVRQLLLFSHAIAFAFAVVTVLREDVALLTTQCVDVERIEASGRTMVRLLAALWLTGIALIVLQRAIDPASALLSPKLAAKLSVVVVLTFNGLLLHELAFPRLARPHGRVPGAATICTILGAVSTTTWLFASFLGLARWMPASTSYGQFMTLYAIALALGLMVALAVVRPRLEAMLAAAADEQRFLTKLTTFRRRLVRAEQRVQDAAMPTAIPVGIPREVVQHRGRRALVRNCAQRVD
jgi:hypothetical protein